MLSLIFMLFGLIISLMFMVEWSYMYVGFMMLSFLMGSMGYTEGLYFSYLSLNTGIDVLSWSLMYLTFWISGLMVLASTLVFRFNLFTKEFCLMVLLLCLFLNMVFCSSEMMWMYIYFEASLIPTFFLISGWGYQPERMKAGLYLFFYTMFGSLPLLLGILFINNNFYSLSFHLFNFMTNSGHILCMMMMLAFLVKMPMFLVHLWLPKAHVEAPVAGSMILAGLLLKLGGYGLFRIMMLFSSTLVLVNKFIILLSLYGGFIISLMCLRQIDLKCLIAYSSVVHMGLVLSGMMVMTNWGYQGALTMMLGHGLCSSGMFAAANIFYERGGTRSMLMNKGLIGLFPSLMLWWFVLCISNMSSPPSLNLLGEISLLISLVSWSINLCIILFLVSFFSAAYSIYLFSLISHGKSLYSFSFYDIKIREYLLLCLHWIPLNVMIFKGDLAFCWL